MVIISITKLLEEVISKVRELPEAEQDMAAVALMRERQRIPGQHAKQQGIPHERANPRGTCRLDLQNSMVIRRIPYSTQGHREKYRLSPVARI
jgi:hypothetical protein